MEAGEEATELHYGATHPERRKYPRFNVDLPIQYNKIDSSTSRNGRVMNLSEGGMLIQSHERMEIGRHLKSEFSFIRGCEFGTIKTLAEVVWQDIFMTEAWGDYRHGLKFLEVSGKDKVKLDDFLVSLS
jgi:c-di-GMP-binding flagellar brake protein YcgR